MTGNLINQTRWFWAWQDDREEAWLAEMSHQGLHLQEPASFGRYLFLQGSPREYAYRMDFNKDKAPDDYIQLIRDAGWEYLGKRAGWSYWRKAIEAGKVPDLFSDVESKIQKYQRLLASYSASVPGVAAMYIVSLAAFKQFPGRHPLWFVILYISIVMGWILFAALNAVMIGLRISTLRKKNAL